MKRINIRNIITEAIDTVVMQNWINGILKEVNEYLSSYGLSVTYNEQYNFQRNAFYRECYAIYQRGSVKYKGRIKMGLNIPLIQSEFGDDRIRHEIDMSI